MDGDGAPGSGATPGSGSGSTSGLVPGTPAEKDGLDKHASLPSGPGVTGEDVEAFEQLVALASGSPPPTAPATADGRSLSFSWRRKYFWAAVAGGMAVAGTIVLLLFMITRPSGADTPPTGAGGPAASVQLGDAAQPSVDEAQPGAVGDGGSAQPGGEAGIVPASCKVPISGYQVELRDLNWTVELASSSPAGAGGSGDVAAGWDTGVRNLGSEPIAVFRHFSTHATREGAPNWKPILPIDDAGRVNNAWDRGWVRTEAGVASDDVGYSSVSLSGEPPPLCDYRVVDRLAVLYARPECLEPIFPRMKESEADPTVRAEFMDPLAVEGILPDQMATLSCP
jgi:hypothetical protein